MPRPGVLSHSYQLDPETRVFRPRRPAASFDYSDGDEVEQRLMQVLTNASDLSLFSLELAKGMIDWPSRYHLGAARANLLRPLQALLQGRILEVGAGCGAVTRYLGERGADVIALEGSPRRAALAAARCRDLPNVHVVCDRFEDFPPGESFDVITLIGVLEWTRLFGQGPDPVQTVLERARALLRDGGSLLLAIENQLGLKYFAGYVEDHTGIAMHGINDLYGAKTAVTFGRHELAGRLRAAGFRGLELFVPLPDYKLATTVITPAGLSDEGWLEAQTSLLGASAAGEAQRVPLPLFSLEKAFRIVARNRLLPDLANSFLIRASPGTLQKPITDDDGLLAVSYATSRRPEFAKQTSIHRCGGGLEVRRARLLAKPEALPKDVPLRIRLDPEPFRVGRLWTDVFCDLLNRQGWTLQDVAGWAATWLGALADRAGVEATDACACVPGRFLDATPYNLMQTGDGQQHFIDLEWETDTSLELGFLFFRGMFSSLAKLRTVAEPETSVPRGWWDVVTRTAQLLGLRLEPEDLARYVELEARVQLWATGVAGATEEKLRALELPVRPRLEVVAAERARELAEADAAHERRRSQFMEQEIEAGHRSAERVRAELARLERSPSWRLLAPVRHLGEAAAAARTVGPGSVAALARVCRQPQAIADAVAIVRSGLFDADFYRRHYPDVDRSGRAPLLHYLAWGSAEGRWPNCLFDPVWYGRQQPSRPGRRRLPLADFAACGAAERRNPHALFDVAYYLRNPEVAQRGTNPLTHYLRWWAFERRSPHPLFDIEWYLARNPAVEDSHVEPISHFFSCGASERRDPHPLFSVSHYVDHNPDVVASGQNPLVHFLEVGGLEGRSPHPLFDASYYLAENEDVRAAGVNPLLHYLAQGASEGRRPNPVFDARFYAETYPDVAASGLNPLQHYVERGALERRQPARSFSPRDYLVANPDVASAGVEPLVHYLLFGRAEGRSLHP